MMPWTKQTKVETEYVVIAPHPNLLIPCPAYKTEKDNLLETDIKNLKSIAECNAQLRNIELFYNEQFEIYNNKKK